LEYEGVPEVDCVKAAESFERSSPFDLSCSKPGGLFKGADGEANLAKIVEYLNKASRGNCVYVDLPEVGVPFSINVKCMKNGL